MLPVDAPVLPPLLPDVEPWLPELPDVELWLPLLPVVEPPVAPVSDPPVLPWLPDVPEPFAALDDALVWTTFWSLPQAARATKAQSRERESVRMGGL